MSSFEKNVHTVEIRSELNRVVAEIIRWGEAPWWPKNSQMRFVCTAGAGDIRVGTRYRQSVLLPFAPSWNVVVQELTDASITRRFLDGMFTGFETVKAASGTGGVTVSYEMHCRINGIANKLLWPVIFRRLHDANIELILKSLKEYVEKI